MPSATQTPNHTSGQQTVTLRKFTPDEERTFVAVRLRAIGIAPYLSTAIFSLTPVAAIGLDTYAVDENWRLYIDPAATERWGVKEAAGVLIHEVNHVIRDHSGRAKSYGVGPANHKAWNLAGDAEINDDLVECGFDLPAGLVLPESLPHKDGSVGHPDGQLAETYYSNFPTNEEHGPGGDKPRDGQKSDAQQGDGQDGDQGDSADGQDGENGQGGQGQETDETTDAPGNGGQGGQDGDDGDSAASGSGSGSGSGQASGPGSDDGEIKNLPGFDGCGSGSGGAPGDFELPADDKAFPGQSPMSQDLARRKVAQDVQEAARNAGGKGRGTIPAGLRRWADETLAVPQVPWQTVLRGAIRQAINVQAGRLNYSYRKPGRRRIPRVITPAMHQPIPKVATIIDTSGSMGDDAIKACKSEVEGIVKRAGLRGDNHIVLDVDAAVHGAQRVRSARDLQLDGGGGTDMRVGFDAALGLRPKANIIVCLTDGWTPWPEVAPPGVSVIIGLVGNEGDFEQLKGTCPDWAKVVEIDLDKL